MNADSGNGVQGGLVFPTLHTERLIIRAPAERDLASMPAIFHDEELYAYTGNIPYPFGPEDARAMLDRTRAKAADGSSLILFPALKNTDELIGLVLLAIRDEGTAELGYALGRAYWGRGYATEASRAMLSYGFETLGLRLIQAHAMTRNPASSRVLKKLKMDSGGVLPGHCEKDGARLDAEQFTLDRAAWERKHD